MNSKKKHSRGPWSIKKSSFEGIVTITTPNFKSGIINLVRVNDTEKYKAIFKKDCALISASPLLLRACKAALKALECISEGVAEEKFLLKRAIKKAKGE